MNTNVVNETLASKGEPVLSVTPSEADGTPQPLSSAALTQPVRVEVVCFEDIDGVYSVTVDKPGVKALEMCLNNYEDGSDADKAARRLYALRVPSESFPIKLLIKGKNVIEYASFFPVEITVRLINTKDASVFF